MEDNLARETFSRFADGFRAPLAAIQGAVRALALLHPEAAPDERRLLELLEASCQQLAAAVEKLLAAVTAEGLDYASLPAGEGPAAALTDLGGSVPGEQALFPGSSALMRTLRQRIASGARFAVCYADLDNLKAYNDLYGFPKGDQVIQQLARIILEAVRSAGGADDFVGHTGGDDFVVVTTPGRAGPVCRRIVQEFNGVVPLFYDADTRGRGYIETVDRQGRLAHFPLMTISLVIITNERRAIEHPGQIGDIAAALMRKAKAMPGSTILRDRRTK